MFKTLDRRRVTHFNSPHALLLGFFVSSMLAAASAKLAEFEPFRRRLLVFRRRIITTLTIRALQYNVVARHNLPFEISEN